MLWDIVFEDVTKVIQEFFVNGKLFTEINRTIIALLSIVTSPSQINDFMPFHVAMFYLNVSSRL